MGALGIARIFLHSLLWACAVVLLGLTAYRIHYTKSLDNGDILTSSSHFYDGVIVEMMVTSCLAILGSMVCIGLIAGTRKGSRSSMLAEGWTWILWVMFLVGAAIITHKWLHLKWCRGSYKVCRILETIKAFSWICFGLTSFLVLLGLIDFLFNKGKETYRSKAAPAAYPETRTAQPVAATTAPHTTETTYTEVRAANEPPHTTV
ncbi:hypothetical protein FA13DRAFT_1758862 [Coprinellus micaceus]|uniref:MARVEL domain-containing protein n=1 Tax=Coprinellus micaceus TaxID=71717 RepID=A0A4Y7SAF4_COPMI|nr:hypothetical protein FA13DRAFT_1758862 [Coprinellus micaceus]